MNNTKKALTAIEILKKAIEKSNREKPIVGYPSLASRIEITVIKPRGK